MFERRKSLWIPAGLALGLTSVAAAQAPSYPSITNFTKMTVKTSCLSGGKDVAVEIEPSGIAWDGVQTLYAVGDNGVIASRDIDAEPSAEWKCLHDWGGTDDLGHAMNDFESIAVIPPRLYVGVEGTTHTITQEDGFDRKPKVEAPGKDAFYVQLAARKARDCKELCLDDERCQAYTFDARVRPAGGGKRDGSCFLKDQTYEKVTATGLMSGVKKGLKVPPQIVEYTILGSAPWLRTSGNIWYLGSLCVGSGSGVESMTFVRDPNETDPAKFNGFFLASSQTHCSGQKDGAVFAYSLPRSSPSGTYLATGKPFYLEEDANHADRQARSSDFFYSKTSGMLYVTYDHEKGTTEGGNHLFEYTGKETGLRQELTKAAPKPFAFNHKTDLVADILTPPATTPKENRLLGAEAVTVVNRTADKVDLFVGYDMSPGQSREMEKAGKDAQGDFLLSTMVAKTPQFDRRKADWSVCATLGGCPNIRGTDCGWCAEKSATFYGGNAGPRDVQCSRWIYEADDCECAAISECSGIKDHSSCGWCKGVGALPMDKKQPKVPGACSNENWVHKPKNCP